ncbi:gene transfer agent family protein [Rhizobium straminoryzae]|uniref:Gene transfer agent family protein n=1 Tax=Rhizobium straminoryzae TaxID=1387186 RepID=A0A549SM12_9HYPH|nr:gene transfer agent family protein [Rhizobium straminoryzae]
MERFGQVGNRANRRRGEIEAVIDGERRILCLTLGALAELETAFAADDLTALAARFSRGRLTATDLVRILGAGLRGGGNLYSDEEVAAMSIEGGVAAYAAIAAALLEAAFGGEAGVETMGDGRRQADIGQTGVGLTGVGARDAGAPSNP